MLLYRYLKIEHLLFLITFELTRTHTHTYTHSNTKLNNQFNFFIVTLFHRQTDHNWNNKIWASIRITVEPNVANREWRAMTSCRLKAKDQKSNDNLQTSVVPESMHILTQEKTRRLQPDDGWIEKAKNYIPSLKPRMALILPHQFVVRPVSTWMWLISDIFFIR